MLNNPSPLPLKNEPDDKKILPLNILPESTEVTTNPLSGLTDAVTLPLAIRLESPDNADCGISNKFLPLPLNDALISLASILSFTNKLPVIVVFPINLI